MSFPRAKINRFNDVQTDNPSPTRYDPKSADKAKGCVIGKGERERTMSSTSDTLSTGGTPFRTPFSVVKKHSCVASTDKSEKTIVRGMNFGEPGLAPLNSNFADKEALQSEVASRNHEISEYKKLVDDLTEQVRSVQEEKSELNARLLDLDTAKVELECLVSKNASCEAQICELTAKLGQLEGQLTSVEHVKNELLEKWAQEEEKITKLEDGNVEYEKRIISLEGTLEQVTMEYNEKVEQVRTLTEQCEKLKTTIECLQGKIAALEMEVTKLETSKSQNEETIFGLEQRVSSLNYNLESARSLSQTQQKALAEIEAEMEERKKACAVHEDTITGLDMQLEAKQNEFVKLATELENTVAEKKSLETLHLGQIEDLTSKKDDAIRDLTDQLFQSKEVIKEMLEERKTLIKSHEEEAFFLQNEWEKKILAQMQEAEQALLEKEAVMKLADLKNTRLLSEARKEWEIQLREAEIEASRRQSAQLEAGEMLKAKYEARVADLEATIAQVLESKGVEAAVEKQRYREVCEELSIQIESVKAKELEITQLTSCNQKTTARLNNMLEEVKILNAENATKTKDLEEMTRKFNDEWKKNEKLSEQLGELDTKMAAFNEEMENKLKTAKDECDGLKLKNLDLQLSVARHKDAANNVSAELEASRLSFNSQLLDLTNDLTCVKQQCRKFEIAMSDTRRSLEALGHRLIESENEIERLNQENEIAREKLASAENGRNEADNNCRLLMDAKIDLEQQIVAAEEVEVILRQKIKELELKNCSLELTKNELDILKETLEEDKAAYDKTLGVLRDVVNEQNLKMIELERASLDQIDAVSQALLTKLDEFQKFSTAKIRELNAEIHRISKEKETINCQYQFKCEEYETLFTDHDILKTTFDIATKENQSAKINYDEQIKLLKGEVKEYQAKLLKNMDEVAALLLNFESEHKNVEQLENNRKQLLTRIQELDETVGVLQNDLEQTRMLNENLNTQLDDAKQNIEILNSDISSIRDTHAQQVNRLEAELSQAKEGGDWKLKWERLQEEKEVLSIELLAMTDKKDHYKFHCQRLENESAESKKDCDDAVKDFDELHGVLKEKQSEIKKLVKRINDLESLIGPFREQLELYESERMMLENDREQLRKQHLEQAAKLGHQNHKQKIQHVVKLKNDILELRKENQKLQVDLKNKNKVIEHLREEVGEHPKRLFLNGKRPTSTPFKGKENDGRMSPNTGIKQEPMSPNNLLKDRNS